MIAISLVFAVFVFFMIVGRAFMAAIKTRFGELWTWLLAPTVGLAITLLLTATLSKWEVPIRVFGPAMTLTLLVASVGVYLWRRFPVPWRALRPYLIIVALFLAYTGWPQIWFGFNWISYGNDDMANYCLAAERFLHHGYYELPLQTELEGTNYTQHFWFMHALQQIRPGSEILLSWLCSVSGLNAHQAFMPLILALSLVQVFAAATLALWKGRWRRLSVLTAFLLATSPLFALGTLYQLIAQVGGIAMLTAASALLLTERRLDAKRVLTAGGVVAALCLYYPEVAPFLALSIAVYGIRLRYAEGGTRFKPYAIAVGATAVLTFLFLGTSTYQFLNTLILQVISSTGLAGAVSEELKALLDQGLILFPWTLVPSFVPMLFGLHAFGVVGEDPWISILIILGFVVLLAVLWRILLNVKKGTPAGYIGAIMVPLGFQLFFKNQDFGLFKLAMFAQPFLVFFIAQYFMEWSAGQRAKWARVGLVVFVLLTIPNHFYYTRASVGDIGGGLTEVVGASKLGVEFTPPQDLQYDAIESDISNVVSAKVLSVYTRGTDTRFLSRSYMDNVANNAVLSFLRDPNPTLDNRGKLLEYLKFIGWMLPDVIYEGDVPDYKVMTVQTVENNWTETSTQHLPYDRRLLVSIRRDLDHFNKFHASDGWIQQGFYQYIMEDQVKNHLIFVHSELGPHYYSSARFKAAFFQREPEPLTGATEYFHGTGRYNTFNLVNPAGRLRLVIDFTRTSLGEGRTALPTTARIIGADDYPVVFRGNGSARVFSQPVDPERIEGRDYLTVDFGEPGRPIRKPKTGLMRLYGENLNLDDRRLVGFTRDISVITEEQYRALPRPARIKQFPQDLHREKGLEYSGMYEDGWIALDSRFVLGESKAGDVLVFKGMIPDAEKFKQKGVNFTLSVNGVVMQRTNLRPGDFTVTVPLQVDSAYTDVELNFDDSELYGSARGEKDMRPLSAYVRELAIESGANLSLFNTYEARKADGFSFDGIDTDGWGGSSASFRTPAFPTAKTLVLEVEMPGWATIARNELSVTVSGGPARTFELKQGSIETIRVPLPQGGIQDVRLSAANLFELPNGDARQRAYLLKAIRFE